MFAFVQARIAAAGPAAAAAAATVAAAPAFAPNYATAPIEEIVVSKKQNEEPVLVQQLLARSR